MTTRIRELEAKDKAQWLALFKGYIAFYQATVSDEIIEATWTRLLEGAPDFHIALVPFDPRDEPIGIAHVLFHCSTWSATQYCYLEDLFVEPTRRAKGVG